MSITFRNQNAYLGVHATRHSPLPCPSPHDVFIENVCICVIVIVVPRGGMGCAKAPVMGMVEVGNWDFEVEIMWVSLRFTEFRNNQQQQICI